MSQLHTDLQAVRKSRKMSIQDVYDKTRLSLENIEQIEDGSIFQSDRNQTYVRSFIRTYARGIGIDDQDMIRALDQIEAGSYDGSIYNKYLKGEEPPSTLPPESGTKPESSVKPDVAAKAPQPEVPTTPPTPSKEKTPGAAEPEPSSRAKESTQPRPKVLDGSSIGPGKTGPVKIGGTHVSPPPKTGDVNWSDLGRKSGKSGNTPVLPIIGGILALILLGALLFWMIRSSGEPAESTIPADPTEMTQPEQGAAATGLPSDTLDAPVPPDPSRTAAGTIPDTLSVVVYAARGNLEPFRVSSDTFENRRPYWVEQGVGMRISFIDEIRISGSVNRMLVLYDGRVISTFAEINEAGERILRRSQFEEDPSLESFTNARLPDGVREPREIIDRPLIN